MTLKHLKGNVIFLFESQSVMIEKLRRKKSGIIRKEVFSMNIGFGEKHLESVAVHLNDTKKSEISHTDNQKANKEVGKIETETTNDAVRLQISMNEDGTAGTDKLRTESVGNVDEEKSKDKTEEVTGQEVSQDRIAEIQRKMLENFNI